MTFPKSFHMLDLHVKVFSLFIRGYVIILETLIRNSTMNPKNDLSNYKLKYYIKDFFSTNDRPNDDTERLTKYFW